MNILLILQLLLLSNWAKRNEKLNSLKLQQL